MKHYAMIFYASRALTPEELKQRQVEIAKWAQEVRAMGIHLDPRSFGAPIGQFSLSEDGVINPRNGGTGAAYSNIVFLDSGSEEQALHVAKMHPGVNYGSTVEVREWTSPVQNATKP
jgi:hypothetical protein